MRYAAILPRHLSPNRPLWRDRAHVRAIPSDEMLAVTQSPILARVLQARGLTPAQAQALLHHTLAHLSPTTCLPAMETAVNRLLAASRAGQQCVVFGDYDADGVTGTTILVEALTQLGLRPIAMLPHRVRDGYGIGTQHVERIARLGITLLITIDCGTNAHAALALAHASGIEVIVLDHHPLQGDDVASTACLINPHTSLNAPLLPLCGAGMAHLLVRALAGRGATLNPDDWLDLVALGTVADVVPLVDDNRLLVRAGIEALAGTRRPGLRALLDISQVSRLTLTPRDISFGLAPRLNAAGRLDDAQMALDLLLATRPRVARPLAESLDRINGDRQMLTRRSTDEACVRVDALPEIPTCITVWDATWHSGVVGLVAARLVERYQVPAVVIGLVDGRWRGSARSVPGFDIAAALAGCSDLLIRHGGHAMAAGLEVAMPLLDALRLRLDNMARHMLHEHSRVPRIDIDIHLAADEVDWSLADAVHAMDPCGAGWPPPVVAVHNAHILERRGEGGAVRLVVAGRDGMAITAPTRSSSITDARTQVGDVVDLVVIPTVRDQHGYRCLELDVLDSRPSEMGEPSGATEFWV